jgi:ferric-dicitrate binding protein FerR (iron transport regulator)
MVLFLKSAQKQKINVNKYDELQRFIQSISKKRSINHFALPLLKYAAAFVILLGSLFYLSQFDAVKFKEYTATDTKQHITLADGTQINLREGATLKVSRLYNISNRKVSLNGEAFFQVNKNKDLKFVTNLENCMVTVLGTKFNIKAHGEVSEVMVQEGKVAYTAIEPHAELILTQGMSAHYTKDAKLEEQQFVANKLGWNTGEFKFDKTSLAEVFLQLETFYPVNFKLEGNYTETLVSMQIADMTLLESLQFIKEIIPELEYEIVNNKVTIY